MKKFRIVWDERAVSELKEIFEYVFCASPSSAVKVRDEIMNTVKRLSTMPRMFQVYEFANAAYGEYRSAIRWSYRIIYEIINGDVHIVRIIHTSRNPGKIIL